MSQGIQERNLPVADSIGEGDKVRIVTSAGNSKQIDASALGGALKVIVTHEFDASTQTHSGHLDKTYREIENAQVLMFVDIAEGGAVSCFDEFEFSYDSEYGAYVELKRRGPDGTILFDFEFTAQTKDDTLVMAGQ